MATAITINPTYIYKIDGRDVSFYLSDYWSMTESPEYTDNWYLLTISWTEGGRVWRMGNIQFAKGSGKAWRKAMRELAQRLIQTDSQTEGRDGDLLATDDPSQVSSHSDAPKPHHHKEG